MSLQRLSDEELLKINSDRYNMEQLLIYVNKLETGYKIINKILNGSEDLSEIKKIVNKIMDYI